MNTKLFRLAGFCFALPILGFTQTSSALGDTDEALRIIAFGAHPEDAEFQLDGFASKWVAVSIDETMDKKLDMLDAMASQVYYGGW